MLVVQGLPTEQASVCTFTYSKFATLRILKFASSFFIASRCRVPSRAQVVIKNRLVRSGVWIDFSSRPPSKCNFWACCSYLFGG